MSKRQDAVDSFSPELLRLPVMPVSNSVIKALRAPLIVEDCVEVPEVLALVQWAVAERSCTTHGDELEHLLVPFLAAGKVNHDPT
jgi:hypothetical protein